MVWDSPDSVIEVDSEVTFRTPVNKRGAHVIDLADSSGSKVDSKSTTPSMSVKSWDVDGHSHTVMSPGDVNSSGNESHLPSPQIGSKLRTRSAEMANNASRCSKAQLVHLDSPEICLDSSSQDILPATDASLNSTLTGKIVTSR